MSLNFTVFLRVLAISDSLRKLLDRHSPVVIISLNQVNETGKLLKETQRLIHIFVFTCSKDNPYFLSWVFPQLSVEIFYNFDLNIIKFTIALGL